MAILTRKEANKLKGKYYAYSDNTINYVFKITKAHKRYCEGVKLVIQKGFVSLVTGVILVDSLHQNNFEEITKDEFMEMVDVSNKMLDKLC